MNYKSIIRQIEKRRDAVGKERDKLAEMIGELEALKYTCDDAYESLDFAIEALSRQA
jgi:hypothetical protein